MTLNEYYQRNMDHHSKTDEDKEIDGLIEWQRKKKYRDEQRHLQLSEKAMQESK